jgi:hypothetical protein
MPSDFQHNVWEIIQTHHNGWILDGNYTRKLGGVLDEVVTDLVCKRAMSNLHSRLPLT